jgi:hypothetical protein
MQQRQSLLVYVMQVQEREVQASERDWLELFPEILSSRLNFQISFAQARENLG